jgi:hypothetical protein
MPDSEKPSVPVRVEFQIAPNAELLKKFKVMGELKKEYPQLKVVKYTYIDPEDDMIKGVNPADNIPIVPKAYITVTGPFSDIKSLAKSASC